MKNTMLKAVMTALLLMSLSACTNENNQDAQMAALFQRIQEAEQENEKLRKENGETGLVADKPTTQYSNLFLQNFCGLLEADVTEADLMAYAPNQQIAKLLKEQLQKASANSAGCQFQGMKLYDHPFDIAEFKTNFGYLYVQATYNKEFKVNRFIPMAVDSQLEMNTYQVPTRDGKQLTTYVIHKAKLTEKLGSIFLRTPYMVYGHYINYTSMALAYNKALVIQANRGSHNSTGHFEWLAKQNIDDSHDSLSWIESQKFSNGKVVAYGVSYDGFDALASGSTNHPALKAVLACSAPANAATDSFTSNKFVENGIFSYVTTDRKTSTMDKARDYFEFINLETSYHSRAKMDDILLGMDSEEWNITNGAIDNKDHPYWSSRQILDELVKSNIPTMHIGGLNRDQDGRDTLLAYEHLAKHALHKDKHFLVIHKAGHGCGNAFRLPLWNKMIRLTDTEPGAISLVDEPQITHYFQNINGYVGADTMSQLPLETKELPIAESFSLKDYALMNSKDPNLYETYFEIPITEETNINGAAKFKMYYKTRVPEVPVHVNFVIVDDKGQFQGRGWRTGFITDKVNEVGKAELTFQLVKAQLQPGAKIYLVLSTHMERVFLRQPSAKRQLSGASGDSIEFLGEPGMQTQLELPVEKKAAPEEQGQTDYSI